MNTPQAAQSELDRYFGPRQVNRELIRSALVDGLRGLVRPVQRDANMQLALLQSAHPRTDKHECADDRKDPETDKTLQ